MTTKVEPDSKLPEADKAEFEQVLQEELDLLSKLRDECRGNAADSTYQSARAMNLAGLAFSGGGIRSATFNLGVIQALSRYGLLSKFDYLSTVSGGGYIGGWLSALLHHKVGKVVHQAVVESTISGRGYIGGWLSDRLHHKAAKTRNAKTKNEVRIVNQEAVEDFQACLKTHPDDACMCGQSDKTVGFSPVEDLAVRYLRRYSNYLSPRLGLSGDMLAAASIFLRNFTLIQLSLITLVASILLLAHTVAVGSTVFAQDAPWVPAMLERVSTLSGLGLPHWLGEFLSSAWPFVGGALALMFSVWSAGRLLAARNLHHDKPASASRAVSYRIVLPCLMAAWWFSAAAVLRPNQIHFGGGSGIGAALPWVLGSAVGYALAWGLGYIASRPRRRADESEEAEAEDGEPAAWTALVIAAAVSGALLGLLLFAAACHIKQVSSVSTIDIWHAVAFGPPLFLLGLSFVVTLHIGAVRRSFSEDEREWFARLGGFVLFTAAAWALLFTLILYASPFVRWLAGGGFVALGTWAGGSGLGAWFARSPATSGTPGGSPWWKEAITQIAPWLFLAGLVVIVADLTHITLMKFLTEEGYVQPPDTDFGIAAASTLRQLNELPLAGTVYALIGVGSLFGLITWRLDINLFSLHALYCNRLARAYLGASRAGSRKPNPFTGFDPKDDMPFSDLAQQRPIPIINTAINMTGGDDLAWQTRRAASFAFTPCWAGYETRSTQGTKLGCYRPTKQYAGDRKLGTLMAVSGAAASPNMGYHTSAAVAALMTAFNLRLGRWCGNPDPEVNVDIWKEVSPAFATKPIFAELTGSATAKADWINLTDGGHFENLGVYELIRRRCRLIVVTDVGCDPEYQYEDLANLLRKCWTDLGVNIRFDEFEPMHLQANSRYCSVHDAVGRIQYYDGGPDGAIIYLKSSMTGDEWPDIRQYADAHKKFPHETTADQFFDENQFEAYRHQGYKVVAKMHGRLQTILGKEPKNVSIEEMVTKLVPMDPVLMDTKI
ncbi:MAG: patatin-like phospholipase family protein [Pseudomonadota bacterium]